MADEHVDTGLAGLAAVVTAAVTGEAPKAATLPVPVQLGGVVQPPGGYSKAPLPTGWNLNKVASLVRDVAHNMYDLPDILKKHSLDSKQYAVLEQNEFFKRAVEQFTLDWNTAANTQKRLALEAAIGLEEILPAVTARAGKPTEPLADVVQLVKVLAEIAGTIGAKAAHQPVAPTERFKIVFNLGGDIQTRDASVKITAGMENEIPTLLEAAGMSAPLQGNR